MGGRGGMGVSLPMRGTHAEDSMVRAVADAPKGRWASRMSALGVVRTALAVAKEQEQRVIKGRVRR